MLSIPVFLLATVAFALPPSFNSHPYAQYQSLSKRASNVSNPSLTVDLGYSIYTGYIDRSTGLNTWKGIRFGQDTSKYRWQAPRAPLTNRSQVISATSYGPTCPQAPNAGLVYQNWDSGSTTEDCLFLNVQTPSNVTSETGRPVFVAIHGGGYGSGSSQYDWSKLMASNDNKFIAVSFQYRLNAFGFLSSDEVYRKGTPNAGLLDQQLALHWVQQYIDLFGGDKTKVTIFGESAGGGSVMLHE